MAVVEKGMLRSLYREASQPGFPLHLRMGVYVLAPFVWLKIRLDRRG